MLIITVDCEYLRPEFAASYLIIDGDAAAFVDNNTAIALPRLLHALNQAGLSPAQVTHLFVTHAHLDHAGGTSALLKQCPRATVVAHPKAARSLIDPTKLVGSARKVYGDSEFDRLYGEISAIPADRVHAVADEEEIGFGKGRLRCFYTLGHATHHICLYHDATKSVFTGDSFGLRYPALQKDGLFIFPSTSPIDFDPSEAKKTLTRILHTQATKAFLTHFGELSELPVAAKQLEEHIDAHARVLDDAVNSSLRGTDLKAFCETKLRDYFALFLSARGSGATPATWDILKWDVELNAAGIAFQAEKRRQT